VAFSSPTHDFSFFCVFYETPKGMDVRFFTLPVDLARERLNLQPIALTEEFAHRICDLVEHKWRSDIIAGRNNLICIDGMLGESIEYHYEKRDIQFFVNFLRKNAV
jgi:hypothetical protein